MDQSPERLQSGLYEHLLNEALAAKLDSIRDPRLFQLEEVEPDDAHSALAQFLEHAISGSLAGFRGEHAAAKQRQFVDRIVAAIGADIAHVDGAGLRLKDPLRRLLAVRESPDDRGSVRPDTPLSRSALLTGTRQDPSLLSQLRKEIRTSERFDVLCSFIKWTGLRQIMEDLRVLTEHPLPSGPRLRVITTSYMGATDPRAVEALLELPNTEIRVSYDTERTRLHAKAYAAHRGTGFGCAYVGSANLSRAALSEGLEWTTKISQYELPYLWQRIVATFESYWNDPDFVPFNAEQRPRLREAIARERNSGLDDPGQAITFDLRPFPFQEEVLDVLAAERERGKRTHLVVAATGTGKTMIAAFDYRRWAEGRRPSVLFIAHREEILAQALASYRGVLRDQNFGDLLVGGANPSDSDHLFCSIQSFNSRQLWNLPADRFDYVVVDEFHHAAAPSYRRLLDYVKPRVLLGLTATPERTDNLDILHWFGGETSTEIRLPDAINRRLLCPFQYFGIADSVNLESLRWERGGYRVEDLDRVYTGNDARASLVLEKTQALLLDIRSVRGLGFCVSVAHAEFMARFFAQHGVPAVALSGASQDEVRRLAQERLRRREVNFIFVVDLYNEGIDIPELDVVLFLRPTESVTLFLQQLGRGLRLHDEKECLTVLDFIGAHRREFRFAPRLRALSLSPTARLDNEIEGGFPHLPPGCSITLERVAQQRVLDNVRASLTLVRPRLVQDIRELARFLGRAPTLAEAIEFVDTNPEAVFKRGLWSQLLADADVGPPVNDPDADRLAKGLRRLCHIDDPLQIEFAMREAQNPISEVNLSEVDRRRAEMLHVVLWARELSEPNLSAARARLSQNPAALGDLRELLTYRTRQSHTRRHALLSESGPLLLHAEYTRDEILIGLGHWCLSERPDVREGIVHVSDGRIGAFFVTLHKTAEAYSPTTMYEDYAINDRLFHWQSQNLTSVESPTGQRFIHQRENGYTPLLFVRENQSTPGGLAAPYVFLGAADYVSHEGSRPISIIWQLREPMPARITRYVRSATAS
jgi:superfamily II DNA or RNA helicase/HKD family nuclease